MSVGNKWPSVAGTIFCSVAIAGLSACGGGGGGEQAALGSAGPLNAPANDVAATAADEVARPDATAQAAPTDAEEKLRRVVSVKTPAPAPAAAPAPAPAPVAAVGTGPMLEDCELFPATAIFNTRIDDTAKFPAHAQSASWVNLIGTSLPFTANWGVTDDPGGVEYYGIPYNVVQAGYGSTDWPVASFNYGNVGLSWLTGWPEGSDCAVPSGGGFAILHNCAGVQASQIRFPFPRTNVLSEHGTTCEDAASCGDHHVLVVEKGSCRLWESYHSYKIGGNWYMRASAAWDLKSNAMRPNNRASADAAGLPITPLLAKAHEAQSGEIKHALRMTLRDAAIALQWQWPARHSAGGDNPGAVPMGALLRLKADFVIPASWTPQARAVATAAKRYGIYVADNGPDFYIQGAPSGSWGGWTTFNNLQGITMQNMEFVDLKAVTGDSRFRVDSMQAQW